MTVKGVFDWSKRYITLPLIGSVVFVVYVFFINDENSIIDRIEYENRIVSLQEEIQQNRDSLQYYRELNRALDTDRATIERVVREYYHMQRPNEDVYIFE